MEILLKNARGLSSVPEKMLATEPEEFDFLAENMVINMAYRPQLLLQTNIGLKQIIQIDEVFLVGKSEDELRDYFVNKFSKPIESVKYLL